MSIKEQLKTRQIGEAIPILKGALITAVYKRAEGEGQYGPWSLQNFMLDDDIKGIFCNLPDCSNFTGRTLTFESPKTKHGFKGVTLELEQYKDKEGNDVKRKIIKVTKTANITDEAGYKIAPGSNASKPMNNRNTNNYTSNDLLELLNYWHSEAKAMGIDDSGAAAAKMVGCSMVINHKIENNNNEPIKSNSIDELNEPDYNSDEEIPF